MAKTGKTSFYAGKLQPPGHTLKKGNGPSFDHFKREMFRQVFALRFQGKTNEEIMKWLEDKYKEALNA